jgi:hypothetical protein
VLGRSTLGLRSTRCSASQRHIRRGRTGIRVPREPYEDAVLLWASGIHFKLPPPPTVDFAFRANNGSGVSLFALGGLIEHIAAIVDSFSDLQGPA